VSGERVFVDGSDVFRLGISTQSTIAPVDIVGGWRFQFGRVSPYAGAGLTSIGYRETSEFSDNSDEVNERKTGPVILAGADVVVLKWVRVGGEMRYRKVRGILGNRGVSEMFGEDDLGGVSLALRLSVGR
jgi:opacity protein-like surface antigen